MARADMIISLSSSVRVTWKEDKRPNPVLQDFSMALGSHDDPVFNMDFIFTRTGTVIGTTKKWLRGTYLIIACDQTNTFYEVHREEVQIMREKKEEEK